MLKYGLAITYKMYSYIHNKVKAIFQPAYAPTPDPVKTIQDTITSYHLEGYSLIPPRIKLTRNPFICYRYDTLNAEYLSESNTLRVCRNKIMSPEDLEGVIRRELAWMVDEKYGKHDTVENQARSVIRACKQEMKDVQDLDEVTQEEAARVCAYYYSKHKVRNIEHRNIDAWHFFTRNLIDKNWDAYSNI